MTRSIRATVLCASLALTACADYQTFEVPQLRQAVGLEGQARIKTTPISGIRNMAVVVPPTNQDPFWHAPNDPGGAVEASLNFAEDGSCAVNLFSRVTDPEADPITLTEPSGDWPAGCTVDYDNGQVSSVATTPGSGSVTVRACETDAPTKCDDWALSWTVVAGGGAPPFVVTPIPNQSFAQGSPVSLNVAPNFQDPDGDPLTFSATGLSGNGLSISTAGLITGTPNSTAVSNSPLSVTVTADDGVDGDVDDTFSITVVASPGDTFTWGTGTQTFNCASPPGGGGPVGPGDIIQLAGGTHSSTSQKTFTGCVGAANNPITVRNDPSANQPATVRKTSSGGFVFVADNSRHIVIDGTGKWNGAGANGCGRADATDLMAASPFPRNCGIVLDATAAVTSFFKITGTTTFVTVKGVQANGAGNSGRSGFTVNDHGEKLSGVTQQQCQNNPALDDCKWREGFKLLDNYANDTDTEAFYVGPNANATQITDWPLRCNEIGYNLVINSGYDALSIKSNITDEIAGGGSCWSSIHHNYVDGAGVSQDPEDTGNSGACADVFEGGFVNVYSNVLKNCFGPGFVANTQNRPASFGPLPLSIYNNFMIRAGTPGNNKRGININRKSTSTAQIVPTIDNNTLVANTGGGINVASINSTCTARNNLVSGTSGQTTMSIGHCTQAANRTGTVAAQAFADDDPGTNGVESYRLTASSPACNQATNAAPPTDFEDQVRPMDSADDQGADENAACPN